MKEFAKEFLVRFEFALACLLAPVSYAAAYIEIAARNFGMALADVATFALLWYAFGPAKSR